MMTQRHLRRKGFTLLELLIVMGIVGILMTMLGVAVMSSIGSSREVATKSLIIKLNGLLQERIANFQSQQIDPVTAQAYLSLGGNPRRAVSLSKKVLFRQAFPQTWGELQRFNPTLLTIAGETPPTPTTPPSPAESSEVLYFLLTKATVFGRAPVGTDIFQVDVDVKDTDGNGKLEFVDAWGNPLRFYRWPSRLVRGGGYSTALVANPAPLPNQVIAARGMMRNLPVTNRELNRDPDDAFGLLSPTSWWKTQTAANQVTNADNFETGGGGFAPFGYFHTLNTYWSPLIASAGPDGEMGLFEPNDTPILYNSSNLPLGTAQAHSYGYLAAPDTANIERTFDNITNLNIRSGGN